MSIMNKLNKTVWVAALVVVAASGCRHSNQRNVLPHGVYDIVADSRQGVQFTSRTAGVETSSYAQPRFMVVPATQPTALQAERPAVRTNYRKAVVQEYHVPERDAPESYAEVKSDSSELNLPPAKPGECYARVFIPPQYETITEDVLVEEAGNRVDVVPAEYEWVEEQVLIQEESRTLEVVPAEYELVETQVMVTPPSRKTVAEAAVYDWIEEEVLVKEAHTVWKKGKGLSEELDNGTGEILCLVEVPAEYTTVRKKVLVQPAGVRTVEVPAEYKTLRKRVMVSPPRTVEEVIPALYDTVAVQRLKHEAHEEQIPVPARYEPVTRERQVSSGKYSWKRVLCETNLTPEMVKRVQKALALSGYTPGSIDGELGAATLTAIGQYQDAHRLASGGLTYETLKHLGLQ